MSMTTLSREVRRICGEPKRGRPSAECSEILNMLRSSCAARPNHTLVKRQCRPKIKAGRPKKTKVNQPKTIPAARRVAPKGKSASYARASIKKYTPGARSASRKAGMPPLPSRPRASPKIMYCPDIKFTAVERRFLRNPMASAQKKATLRGRCESRTNSLGRACAVRLRTGTCVTK